LAVGFEIGRIKVWDVAASSLITELRSLDATQLVLSPTGDKLLTHDALYAVPSGRVLKAYRADGDGGDWAGAFLPDGQRLIQARWSRCGVPSCNASCEPDGHISARLSTKGYLEGAGQGPRTRQRLKFPAVSTNRRPAQNPFSIDRYFRPITKGHLTSE
jgi:hypothetical protein